MSNSLKKKKVKLDLLTCIDILLIVEKCIRVSICNANYRCVKAKKKYMKDYKK